jgi:uridylate kinase
MVSISLGAVIFSTDGTLNLARIRSISKQLKDLAGIGYRLAVVVGAGGASRPYLDVAKKYDKRKKRLDELCMEVSRANAMVMIASLRARGARVFPRPLLDPRELEEDWFLGASSGVIAVFVGIRPGLTSNSAAALIARKFRCPLLVVSTQWSIRQIYPAKGKS